MNLNEAKQVIVSTHLAAINLNQRAQGYHMVSPPGIGKSDVAEQSVRTLAKELDRPVGLVVFMMATIGGADVRGFMFPFKDGQGVLQTTFSTPPWYPTRANMIVYEPDGTRHAEGEWTGDVPDVGVLFLDEFSQAEDEVKKPAAELVYKGHVGNCHLPLGWRVLSAGNRMNDKSGVVRELMFIVNRRGLLTIDANLPTWTNWANSQNDANRPHYLTLSFAQKNPDIVFRDSVPDGYDPYCTPRTLCLMDRDLRSLRSAEDIRTGRLPLDPVAREVAAGWIGKGAAAQFYTHLKYADELPDIADIIKDPSTAKVPAARDAQMVAAYMLAHNIDIKNADSIMAYTERMQIEMQVLAVRAMTSADDGKRGAALVNTARFGQWLMRHKTLLVQSRS
jgi:hypothetical protein